MSEDDTAEDWFERALREGESSDTDDADATPETDATDATAGDADATVGDGDADGAEDWFTASRADRDDEPRDDDWFEREVAGDQSDDAPSETAEGVVEEDADADPFDDAPGDREASGTDDPFDEEASGGTDDAFGDDAFDATDDPFGDASGGSGDDFFDEDFGAAFAAAGDADFEDESYESSIPRIDIGIQGLDEMIQGGIPERHLIVTIGGPGTGKTTFGLQFLHHALENDENAVFITLEQSKEDIIDTANERGWEFDAHERDGSLAVVDLDPVEMANSLDNIRGELPQLIREFDADRLVLDSVSLLEMMYDDQSRRRTEVFDFTRSLKNAGVTTFLTSEASESNPYASRHGLIEYLTDAVFVLRYVRSESSETRLAVEIQKIRNANHSRETKPYDITMDGITVYQQASIF